VTLNFDLELPTMKKTSTLMRLAGVMLLTSACVCAVNDTRVFKMGLLTPWHLNYDFSGYTSASAVNIAIDKVHADPLLNANGRIQLSYAREFLSQLYWSGKLSAVWWTSCSTVGLYITFRTGVRGLQKKILASSDG